MAAKQSAAGKKQTSSNSRSKNQTSKNQSSKSKTTTKKTSASPSKKEHSEEFLIARKQRAAILFGASAVLVFCIARIEGDFLWKYLHESLFGLFGVCAWALPAILVVLTFVFTMNKSISSMSSELICAGVFVVILSSIIHVGCNDAAYLDTTAFPMQISDAWHYDSVISSGGVLGATIGFVFAKLFGRVPAMITLIVALIVVFMFFTGTTLIAAVRFFSKPVKKVSNLADAKIEQSMRRREENEALREKKRQERMEAEHQRAEAERLKAEEDERLRAEEERRSAEHPKTPDYDSMIGPEPSPQFDFSENDNYLPDYIYPDNSKEAEDDDENLKSLDSTAPLIPEEEIVPVEESIRRINKKKAQETAPVNTSKETDIFSKEVEETAESVQKSYMKPPLSCLSLPAVSIEAGNSNEIEQNSALLIKTLESFNVKASITGVFRGPSVTRYELLPAEGVKISKITNLADDIALRLAASGVRIEAPIPNKAAIGIEVPNKSKVSVTLREIIDTDVYKNGTNKSVLTVALGKDIAGNVICADLAKMPHLLIAGTTGSGKSVCINSMIMSLLFNADPHEVRLLMIDPKQVEFTVYSGIPHLLVPVVSDPRKASGALNWAVSEMLRRYKEFSEKNVRDINGYNKVADKDPSVEKMNRIVIFIDELSDLMMVAQSEVEDAICRLAQMARAAGMHLVIATQRPSVDVITGLIKANIPSRIALSVSSQIDSRTILDVAGAEKLLGNGDMLYSPVGMSKPLRVQGAFVSDMEVEDVVTFIKEQEETSYDEDIMDEIERQSVSRKKGADVTPENDGEPSPVDEKLQKAIEIVVDAQMASTTLLQRKLSLGYARAARLIDELEERKIVGPFEGSKPRKVLITKQQWMEMCALSQDPTEISQEDTDFYGETPQDTTEQDEF